MSTPPVIPAKVDCRDAGNKGAFLLIPGDYRVLEKDSGFEPATAPYGVYSQRPGESEATCYSTKGCPSTKVNLCDAYNDGGYSLIQVDIDANSPNFGRAYGMPPKSKNLFKDPYFLVVALTVLILLGYLVLRK